MARLNKLVLTIVTRSVVVFTALFLIVSVAVVNAESDIEIFVDRVSTNSGLSCQEGTIEIFEDFEDTRVPLDSVLSCEDDFESYASNRCYLQGALLPGFTMNSFGNSSYGRMGVVTPTSFGATNVAVGSYTFKLNTNIIFDVPTDKVSFHIFQSSPSGDPVTTGDPVTIQVRDEVGRFIRSFSKNVGTAAAPTFIEINSLTGQQNIGEIRIKGQNKAATIFYDLAFCGPATSINKGRGALVSGLNNLIQTQKATPGGLVAILFGFQAGSFTVGGKLCNGLELGIMDPRFLAGPIASAKGVVNAIPFVPPFEIAALFIEIVDISTCSILYPATQVPLVSD